MKIGSAMAFSYFWTMAAILHLCQTRSLGTESSNVDTTNSRTWEPEEGTMSDWVKCRGMPKDMCERTRSKYRELQEVIHKKMGRDGVENSVQMQDPSVGDHDSKACMWLTEEQIDTMIVVAKSSEDKTFTGRKKRALPKPLRKWSMPIHYKFDGKHDGNQKSTIRNALQHWMDNTCIRFDELAANAKFDDHHVLITSRPEYGCHSYVGNTEMNPQPINLPTGCLERFGTPVHEIGHTLGLFHEQMRGDRDSAINILWNNIYDYYWSQFSMQDTDSIEIPYNFGSVMHYSSKDTISITGEDTMLALDSLYQMNMGQRTGLSFEDIKVINSAYCQGTCTTPLSKPCLHSGYQNPNNCSSCLCPDGFSGSYCEQVAPAREATCGGMLNIAPETEQVIKSPGYDDLHHYTSHQECSWWIKAPENYQLQLSFDGEFGLYQEHDACYHWVEIKYKKNLGLEGGRFCGNRRPNVTVNSQTNEMMITFRSNYSVNYFAAQRGFQVIVKPVKPTDDGTSTPVDTISTSISTIVSSFSTAVTFSTAISTSITETITLLSSTLSTATPIITYAPTSLPNISTNNATATSNIISIIASSTSNANTGNLTSTPSLETTTSKAIAETRMSTPETTPIVVTSTRSSISS